MGRSRQGCAGPLCCLESCRAYYALLTYIPAGRAAGATGQTAPAPLRGLHLDLSASLLRQIDLGADGRTLLVTQACPPQMVQARGGRRHWACPQFELQKLVGSGKTSNVYQVRPCLVTVDAGFLTLRDRHVASIPRLSSRSRCTQRRAPMACVSVFAL